MRQGAVALACLAALAACVELRGGDEDAGESDVAPGGADAAAAADGSTLPGEAGDAGPLASAERDLEWAMWPLPASSPPNTSYSVTAGTVRDDRTRLVWQRAASAPMAHAEARAACEALELEGQSDWRLPTRIELLSLVDYARSSAPAMNPVAFAPATEAGSAWTTSEDARGPGTRAWFVDFAQRSSDVIEVQSKLRVRCVRGLPDPAPALALEGEVALDPRTGLRWQRRVATPAPVTWTEALVACQSAKTEGKLGWRLPSARELETLYDVRATRAPAWRAAAFPTDDLGLAAPTRATWTSTDVPSSSPAAEIVVDFTPERATTSLGREATALVRCVLGP